MVNFFEKYGIKDVADVTIYRIEKKEDTYESQRKVGIASILKGAVELKTVYPFKSGKGDEDGFQAYVFTDAEINTGANYDCDDNVIILTKTIEGSFKVTNATAPTLSTSVTFSADATAAAIKTAVTDNIEGVSSLAGDFVLGEAVDTVVPSGATLPAEMEISDYQVTYTLPETWDPTNSNTITFTAISTSITSNSEGTTGYEINRPAGTTTVADKDPDKFPGTHEYSYAQQAFMLFAKRQNLISATGTRYVFTDVDEKMGNLIFEDCYSLAPNSSERVVVLGIGTAPSADRDEASWTDADYTVNEVNEALNSLTGSFTAKAYDVVYGSYAELVVEDEMGYFNPKFLGTGYDKTNKVVIGNYHSLATRDTVLAAAQMWGEGIHFSINDAIDALRQVRKEIDADITSDAGVGAIYGGYKVNSSLTVGQSDLTGATEGTYTFYKAGTNSATNLGTSKYSLTAVIDELASLAYAEGISGTTVGIDYSPAGGSNRAIYVNIGGANVAAKSYIYLLHNKNYRKLSSDDEGIFTFADKKGNKVYYQDKIFAKTEWLAIVVVGTKGFVFVANRNGTKDVSKIAWMVSDGDFVSDKAAQSLVANGLIHTTTITVNNETFEATCAVKKLTVRKTKKIANRYIPVLFLDTLQVSTIEQTAEEVYATGGRGNSNLIGWDFGKAITLNITDALFTPASMSAMLGSYDGDDFKSGVKETKSLDRTEKCIAPRSFIVPAGNQNGVPSEADKTAQAVYIDPNTMDPYADGTPIAQGETYLKWTRSIAYEGQSLGNTIEISAEKFPGTYKIVGETFIKSKSTGKDERFQFVVPQAKFQTEQTITLEASGDPSVNILNALVKIA